MEIALCYFRTAQAGELLGSGDDVHYAQRFDAEYSAQRLGDCETMAHARATVVRDEDDIVWAGLRCWVGGREMLMEGSQDCRADAEFVLWEFVCAVG